ncbi:PadR family transcriptional regulator [Schleiferilactobacillus harbinensis]|uniref:PadR family transcriptional regulator n=1 Tax=Schleiferilactobacillus harbinensis TaxID=304207 RepID=A0ABU7T2W6_9LACO|nr:PadR family transcriptional regulator [Schleiferilactobacillus harbinensis]
MYDLLILGTLMSRNMCGYKLRQVVESSLIPRREISNGVMYPLLAKLEDHGYIEFHTDEQDPRHTKVAQITAAGRARFLALMAAPIAPDAKREPMFRFKFRGMPAVDKAHQEAILDDYEAQIKADLATYEGVRTHLQEVLQAPDTNKPYVDWTIRNLDLSIALCHTKLAWITDSRQAVNQKAVAQSNG